MVQISRRPGQQLTSIQNEVVVQYSAPYKYNERLIYLETALHMCKKWRKSLPHNTRILETNNFLIVRGCYHT